MPRERKPEPVSGGTLQLDILHRLEYCERLHRLMDAPDSRAHIETTRGKRLSIERGEPTELDGRELPMCCPLPRNALYQFTNNELSLIRSYQ